MNCSRNLICKVCDGTDFQLNEGFYHCTECYTRHDDVQEVIFEPDYEAKDDRKHTKVHKMNASVNKPQISSWECYNYILRGLVEELITIGAKEALEEITLKIWAAYLSSLEVVFFSRDSQELPKLNARYLNYDAEIIYNAQQISKRPKRKKGSSISETQQSASTSRDWRNKKCKLDETLYKASSVGTPSQNNLSFNVSTTAINLCFNTRSTKYIKTEPSLKNDDTVAENNIIKQPRVKDMQRLDHMISVMNIKQLYCILAIGLNLIQDEIQLCDLVNFIREGHVGSYNVLKYFPEVIAANGTDILKKIEFYSYPLKYSEKCLRHHSSLLCKNVGINKLKSPQFINLVKRYTLDLCLPSMVASYATRLIKVLPPEFNTRARGTFPAYEARAMAYIIFVLKLLFGLEDNKEHIICEKAKILNDKIEKINNKKRDQEKLLFIWSDWVQYIEMRKIIIDYFNPNSREFSHPGPDQDNNLFAQKIDAKINEQVEKIPTDYETNGHVFNKRISCLQSIFKEMLSNLENSTNVPIPNISFKPSLTPHSTNFETILEFINDSSISTLKKLPIKIPSYMHKNHTLLNMKPFVNTRCLKKFFCSNNYHLNVTQVSASNKNKYLGIFRTPLTNDKSYKSKMKDAIQSTDIEFTTTFQKYSAGYYKQIIQGRRKKILKKAKTLSDVAGQVEVLNSMKTTIKSIEEDKICENSEKTENNCDSKTNNIVNDRVVEICISNMDCWSLMGAMQNLTTLQKEQLPNKLPQSFNWLINICAQMLGVDWYAIYEQLLAIEIMFGLGVDNINNFKDCIYIKYDHPVKEFNYLIKTQRNIW